MNDDADCAFAIRRQAFGPAVGHQANHHQAKQLGARGQKFLTGRVTRPEEGDRLPPGQHLVRDWPVLDLGVQPRIPLER